MNLKSALIWTSLLLLPIAIYLGICVYYKSTGLSQVAVDASSSSTSVVPTKDFGAASEVSAAANAEPEASAPESNTAESTTLSSKGGSITLKTTHQPADPEVEKALASVEEHIAMFTVTQADFEALQKILEKDPNNYFAHFLLARCYQRFGLDGMAVQQIQIAEKLAVHPEDLLRRLKHHIEAGEFSEAFSMKQFVFEKAPKDPSLLFLHGLFYLEHGAIPGAEDVFKKLLKRPDCPLGTATALGTIRMDQHKYQEASDLADFDLKINPKYVSALLLKAQSRLAVGDARSVISLLKTPVAQHPFNRRLNVLLFEAYKHEGMNEQALASALYVMAGSDYVSFFEPAMNNVKELLQVLPHSVSSKIVSEVSKEVDRTDYAMKFHFYLGWCYYDLRMSSDAIRETQHALNLDNEFEPNWYQMGLIKEKLLGDLPGALEFYEKAHQLERSDSKTVRGIKRVKYRLRNANIDIARKIKNALRARH